MEDAHMSYLDFVPDTSLFGIFDGHGGKEVAEYAAAHFLNLLKENTNFKEKKFD